MWERFAAGVNVDHWRTVHDRLNGMAPMQPYEAKPDPELAQIMACPDYNPGCCASPAPFCSRFALHPTREKCLECLRESAAAQSGSA